MKSEFRIVNSLPETLELRITSDSAEISEIHELVFVIRNVYCELSNPDVEK